MIKVNHVSKTFDEVKVLHDINLQIGKGSIFGLLGSNGAGKTTLIKLLSGIIKQDAGEVFIDQAPVFENLNIKQRIAFIPDTLYFFSQYSISQMAKFYQSIFPNWNAERFNDLTSVFAIDRNKKIQRLSKGMQRQVAFWLTLCTMPDVLILDEPFDGLDPVIRKQVKQIIIEDVADRQMTVIVSSHNLREIEDLCDHIAIMHQGQVLLDRELDDLKSDFHKIQVAFRQDPALSELDIVHSEKRGSVHMIIARGIRSELQTVIEQHDPLLFDLLPLTLEEIFIYEMGGASYAIKDVLV